MSYFHKLSDRLNYDNILESACVGNLQVKFAPQGQTLSYYYLNNHDIFYQIWPRLSECSPKNIRYATIHSEQPGLFPAHRDHGGLTCCVNWYLNSNGCTTTFYVPKPDAIPLTSPGEKTANVYRFAEIDSMDSFTAQNGDIYLLNVSEIHSIRSFQPGTRQFITFSWTDQSYDELLPILLNVFK